MQWRILFLTAILSLPLGAQVASGRKGAPVPAVHPSAVRANSQPRLTRPVRNGYAGYGGYGGYGSRYNNHTTEVIVAEPVPPPKEDKLHELVVSPTYRQPKLTPKLIEIP